jgi:hypothetical protein
MSNEYDLIDTLYQGFVEDINDPLKIARCKIRIPFIHGDIPIDDIPWANPKHAAFFGKGGLAGAVSIPKIGAVVEVMFSRGNIYAPEYHHMPELESTVKEQLQKDGEYAGTHIFGFDGDEDLKVYFTKKKGLTLYLKGSRINIAMDNSITIEHKETASIIELAGGVITVTSDSEINMTSGTRIKQTSQEVWANGKTTKLGPQPTYAAVLGEPLFMLLASLAGVIDAKLQPSPGAATSAVQQSKRLALSTNVKVSS